MMNTKKRYITIEGNLYYVRYDTKKKKIILYGENLPLCEIYALSYISDDEGRIEELKDVKEKIVQKKDHIELNLEAKSDIFGKREFIWRFFNDHIEHFTKLSKGRIGKCHYVSSGVPDLWGNGTSKGVEKTTKLYFEKMYVPQINHANTNVFTISSPQVVGCGSKIPFAMSKSLVTLNRMFTPPPLVFCFERSNIWTGFGIATKPGEYSFNNFSYSGSLYSGASFYVDYKTLNIETGFESPYLFITFGYSQYEVMKEYIKYADKYGFTTKRKYENAAWHRLPIFCGWVEQTSEAVFEKKLATQLCTQKNYEEWVEKLEERGLPYNTVVIDDKWQEYYGTFKIDRQKWPDLKQFVSALHKKGKKVLLWIPGYHVEGVDEKLCIVDTKGQKRHADVSNPKYQEFLQERIKYLVANIGIDGFKIDWIGLISDKKELEIYNEKVYGIEVIRKFTEIVYDTTHEIKEDALIETQTPNPVFRNCSDVIRLNDVWFGSRKVYEMMRERPRIARIAGWRVFDCDSASSTTLEEWLRYMEEQVKLGTPSLYFIEKTGSTFERVDDFIWSYLKGLWDKYIEEREKGNIDYKL